VLFEIPWGKDPANDLAEQAIDIQDDPALLKAL